MAELNKDVLAFFLMGTEEEKIAKAGTFLNKKGKETVKSLGRGLKGGYEKHLKKNNFGKAYLASMSGEGRKAAKTELKARKYDLKQLKKAKAPKKDLKAANKAVSRARSVTRRRTAMQIGARYGVPGAIAVGAGGTGMAGGAAIANARSNPA